jgi:hypothetical protein
MSIGKEKPVKKSFCWALPVLMIMCGQAQAGNKPGLWEMRIVKNVVDGQDHSAQMAAMSDKMQAAMAKLTPQQRAQMSAMMGRAGMSMGSQGALQMCITPEMAKRDVPVVDKDHACQPANVQHMGNRTTYEFSCTSHGTTTTGKGEATTNGDSVSMRSDLTTKSATETHHIQSEMEMRFVKSDCGDVKPLAAEKLQGAGKEKPGPGLPR